MAYQVPTSDERDPLHLSYHCEACATLNSQQHSLLSARIQQKIRCKGNMNSRVSIYEFRVKLPSGCMDLSSGSGLPPSDHFSMLAASLKSNHERSELGFCEAFPENHGKHYRVVG